MTLAVKWAFVWLGLAFVGLVLNAPVQAVGAIVCSVVWLAADYVKGGER